jgi:hypothetical protein
MRPGILIPVGLVTVLVMGLGLYLFQPWRLFTNVEVREAAPTSVSDLGSQAPEPYAPTPPTARASDGGEASSPSPTPVDAEPVVLAMGSFISLPELPDGTPY